MKKACFIFVLFSFIIFFFNSNSFSQKWGSGGIGYYVQPHLFNPWYISTTTILEFQKDTVVNGISSIKIINPNYTPEFYILKEDGNKIYVYEKEIDAFLPLYDFNKQENDTITSIIYDSYSNELDTLKFFVDSVRIQNFSGKNLKVQYVSQLTGIKFFMGNVFYEGIGSGAFLIPQYSLADPLIANIRCFENSTDGLYKFIDEPNCDTTYLVDGTQDINVKNQFFRIIDNKIVTDIKFLSFRIIDTTGRELFYSTENNLIDVLPGIYWIVFDAPYNSKTRYGILKEVSGNLTLINR